MRVGQPRSVLTTAPAAGARQEARTKKVLDRAAAPAFRKSGKPLMFRSHLPQRQRTAVADEDGRAEQDLEAYLAQELW